MRSEEWIQLGVGSVVQDLQSGSVVTNLPANAREHRKLGFDPWVGKVPWKRNGNPLQYSCLENPMDGGAWRATVHGVAKSRTRLSDFTFTSVLEILHFCKDIYTLLLTSRSLQSGRNPRTSINILITKHHRYMNMQTNSFELPSPNF